MLNACIQPQNSIVQKVAAEIRGGFGVGWVTKFGVPNPAGFGFSQRKMGLVEKVPSCKNLELGVVGPRVAARKNAHNRKHLTSHVHRGRKTAIDLIHPLPWDN